MVEIYPALLALTLALVVVYILVILRVIKAYKKRKEEGTAELFLRKAGGIYAGIGGIFQLFISITLIYSDIILFFTTLIIGIICVLSSLFLWKGKTFGSVLALSAGIFIIVGMYYPYTALTAHIWIDSILIITGGILGVVQKRSGTMTLGIGSLLALVGGTLHLTYVFWWWNLISNLDALLPFILAIVIVVMGVLGGILLWHGKFSGGLLAVSAGVCILAGFLLSGITFFNYDLNVYFWINSGLLILGGILGLLEISDKMETNKN